MTAENMVGQGERDSTRAKRSEREHRSPQGEKRKATLKKQGAIPFFCTAKKGLRNGGLGKKDKKMAAHFFIFSSHSETLFEVKNSEFRCEIKF